MLANPSLTNRAASLETIIRQALLFGELSTRAADTVYTIGQQNDLSEDELRMIGILNEALGQGYVKQGE